MAWFRLDDNGYDHEKVLAAGDRPYGAWCRAGQYCSNKRTDGFLSQKAAMRINRDSRVWARLVEVGLLEQTVGGFRIHDYLVYNPSKAELESKAEAKSEAGKKGAAAKWSRASEPDRNDAAPDIQSNANTDDDDGSSHPDDEDATCDGIASGLRKNDARIAVSLSKTFPKRCADVSDKDAQPLVIAYSANGKPHGSCQATPDAPVPSRPVPLTIPSGSEPSADAPAPRPQVSEPLLTNPEPVTRRRVRSSKQTELKPKAPIGLCWKTWRHMYSKSRRRYGKYVENGDCKGAMVHVAERALSEAISELQDRGDPGGNPEPLIQELLEHWFASYLRDDGHNDYISNARHPLRFILRSLSEYGLPKGWGEHTGARAAMAQIGVLP